MLQGVYVGKSNQVSYDLLSTGDYINPVSPVFKLKDTRSSISKDIPLYVIVNDVDIELIKLQIKGAMSMVKVFLSWDSIKWSKELVKNENIDAIGTLVKIPFFIRTTVDDFLEYFEMSGTNAYKQYKLKLIYI